MPVYVQSDGGNKWVPDKEQKAAVYPGTKETQEARLEIRQEMTIISTARVLANAEKWDLSTEEVNEAVSKNAKCVEMDPQELRELAEGYNNFLESQRNNSNGIEKE